MNQSLLIPNLTKPYLLMQAPLNARKWISKQGSNFWAEPTGWTDDSILWEHYSRGIYGKIDIFFGPNSHSQLKPVIMTRNGLGTILSMKSCVRARNYQFRTLVRDREEKIVGSGVERDVVLFSAFLSHRKMPEVGQRLTVNRMIGRQWRIIYGTAERDGGIFYTIGRDRVNYYYHRWELLDRVQKAIDGYLWPNEGRR